MQFDVHRAIQSGAFTPTRETALPPAAIPVAGTSAARWTASDLLDSLRALRLLEPTQAALLGRDFLGSKTDARSLARELLHRGWLTAYQLNQVFLGRGRDLLLGLYVLLERLGEGGMGQVFKAQHGKMGRIVAVKVIHPKHIAKPDAVRRFRREALAVAKLDHPNIVRAFDAGESDGRHFLVMEYVEGKSLAQVVQESGSLPPVQACDWVRQAALGLQHAHQRGLVHRDIKPATLLLANDSTIKVLDLGLARLKGTDCSDATSPLTSEGLLVGTPDFLAPEQAEEAHAADIRADIYSLGCTLYYLLSCRPPFASRSLGQKLRRHLTEKPPAIKTLRSDLPRGLVAVLRKMMAKRPDDRYQTPAAVAAALAAPEKPAAVANSKIQAKPTGPISPWTDLWSDEPAAEEPVRHRGRRSRRRQWLVLSAAAGLCAAVVAVVLILVLRPPSEVDGLPPQDTNGSQTPPANSAAHPAGAPADFYRWLKTTKALGAE